MSRYFFIQRGGTPINFTDDDLPFSVGGEGCDIVIEDCSGTIAYVGDMDGHLFFQPVVSEVVAFHNNSEVSSSVWLKSGDTFSTCSSVYHYTVSGDHYTFTHKHISEQEEHSRRLPASRTERTTGAHLQGDIGLPVEHPGGGASTAGRWLVPAGVVLGALLAVCLFVLLARPVQIAVSPDPDKIDLQGFPPAVSIGGNLLCLPGRYTVVSEKSGYTPVKKEIVVLREGNNIFSITMEKLPGVLVMTTSPGKGVSVTVDDNLLGVTPLPPAEVSAGIHLLRFEKERYLPVTREVEIEGMGNEQRLDISLAPGWFTLQIQTVPQGAKVFRGGEHVGVTPIEIELLQGGHEFEIKMAGYVSLTQKITGSSGEHLKETIQLRPSPAEVSVTSMPGGAAVLVNGEYSGVTPVQLELASERSHSLTLQAPGYEQLTGKYQFARGESKNLHLSLTPELGTVFFQVEPPTAKLFLDGEKQTNTVGRFRLPTRKIKVAVKHPAYETYTTEVLPKKAYSQNIAVTLRSLAESQGAKPTSADHKKILASPAGKKMILVNPAGFTMGAPRREAGRRANEQELRVMMQRPFYVSEHLVTNKEYRLFRPDHSSGTAGGQSLDGDNQPVVNISWHDAVSYLNWLSRQEGYSPFYLIDGDSVKIVNPKNTGYRLLSEAEWAYIARKAEREQIDKFPWAGGYPPLQSSGNYSDAASRNLTNLVIPNYNDSFAVSSPVGAFPPNAAGFFDIGGNVAEWCHDFYSAYRSRQGADPFGPDRGNLHVIRGSGWRDYSIAELRLSYRRYHNKPQDDVGFRIARYAQ